MPRLPKANRLISVFFALLLNGCDSKPSAPVEASATPPSSSEGAASLTRKLALAKPDGSAPIDREIDRLERAAEHASDRSDAWIVLGQAWIRKARESADPGFYLNAKACADQALVVEPGNRAALDLQAMVLLNDHKFAEAMDLSQQILAKDSTNLMALGTLSDALLEMGRFDEAATAAQKMGDLKPNLPSYSRASYLRWLQGDTASAKEIAAHAYDARDNKNPEPGAWVLVQAAMIFWHEGDYGGADKGFDAALKDVNEFPPALVGKARVAIARGDGKTAVELLERAYKRSPLVETAWLLGDARDLAGDAAGAADAWSTVVKHGRTSDPRTLALFYAVKARDTEEALKLAEGEMKVRPGIYTEDAHAWALYRAGKIAEARAAIDHATRLGTKDASLLYHAGAIRIAGGDRAGGEKLVRDALTINPKFDRTGAAEAERLVQGDAAAK